MIRTIIEYIRQESHILYKNQICYTRTKYITQGSNVLYRTNNIYIYIERERVRESLSHEIPSPVSQNGGGGAVVRCYGKVGTPLHATMSLGYLISESNRNKQINK